MIARSERAHLLERCLRLEAEIIRLKPARRQRVTPQDIAQMRALTDQGLTVREVAERGAWARSTVGKYVKKASTQ